MVGRTREMTFLNFLVNNCLKGTMFVESIDASSYSKVERNYMSYLISMWRKLVLGTWFKLSRIVPHPMFWLVRNLVLK